MLNMLSCCSTAAAVLFFFSYYFFFFLWPLCFSWLQGSWKLLKLIPHPSPLLLRQCILCQAVVVSLKYQVSMVSHEFAAIFRSQNVTMLIEKYTAPVAVLTYEKFHWSRYRGSLKALNKHQLSTGGTAYFKCELFYSNALFHKGMATEEVSSCICAVCLSPTKHCNRQRLGTCETVFTESNFGKDCF